MVSVMRIKLTFSLLKKLIPYCELAANQLSKRIIVVESYAYEDRIIFHGFRKMNSAKLS